MQRKFMTEDGKLFDTFAAAKKHDLVLIEDEIGKLIDADDGLLFVPDNRSAKGIAVMEFLIGNRKALLDSLKRFDEAMAQTEESFTEKFF